MSFNKTKGFVLVILFSLLKLNDASAATISVKCTDTGTIRSSVSVVGAGISGNNYAIVFSGGKAYKSVVKATRLNGTQVFNFDSNATAILNGATPIPASFIQELRVEGYLRQAATHRFVGAIAAICIAK
jgi:hypothetical protein